MLVEMAPAGSTATVVRWEVLKGLPGEGPVAKHFHHGHPTPWNEGAVIRFWNSDGSHWIGNFQSRLGWRAEVTHWRESDSVIVVASRDLYLINARNPDEYTTLRFTTSTVFDEQRTVLFVSDSIRIYAFDGDRRLRWMSEALGGYDIELKACGHGVLVAELEEEMGEPRKAIRIRTEDGTTI